MSIATDTPVKHVPADADFTNFMSQLLAPKQDSTPDEDKETPKMFRVILHNNPNTPGATVIRILLEVFEKTPEQAAYITFYAHRGGDSGAALVGVYSKDVAETKVHNAQEMERSDELVRRYQRTPSLSFTIEEED